jgi:hypothetical protein
MTPEAVRDGTKAWCGMPPWPRSYSRSLRMHALCLPPGVAAGWSWSPQLVAIWVVVHPDLASFAEVVAGEVEGPLDLGFDLAAQP